MEQRLSMESCKKYRIYEGRNISQSYALGRYSHHGWASLNTRSKLEVVKSRLPLPDACPRCGRAAPLVLFCHNREYPDDNSCYEYACRSCAALIPAGKEPGKSRDAQRAYRARTRALLKEIEDTRPDIDLNEYLANLLTI